MLHVFLFFLNSPATHAKNYSDIAACVGEMVEATRDLV